MTTSEKKYSGEFVRETFNNGDDIQQGTVTDNSDDLQRHLGNRQIQLIAIGGSIGTALFVSIGGALNKGGPLGLLLAYAGYSCVIALVNNAMAEMATYMPVSGGFIRMVRRTVSTELIRCD
jgi:amino acid transporter